MTFSDLDRRALFAFPRLQAPRLIGVFAADAREMHDAVFAECPTLIPFFLVAFANTSILALCNRLADLYAFLAIPAAHDLIFKEGGAAHQSPIRLQSKGNIFPKPGDAVVTTWMIHGRKHVMEYNFPTEALPEVPDNVPFAR